MRVLPHPIHRLPRITLWTFPPPLLSPRISILDIHLCRGGTGFGNQVGLEREVDATDVRERGEGVLVVVGLSVGAEGHVVDEKALHVRHGEEGIKPDLVKLAA